MMMGSQAPVTKEINRVKIFFSKQISDTMQTKILKSSERGTKDIGWLKSRFTFSFSNYTNPSLSAFGTLIAFNDDIV